MRRLLHLVQQEGDWAGLALPSPLLTVPNVTAHPSMAVDASAVTFATARRKLGRLGPCPVPFSLYQM